MNTITTQMQELSDVGAHFGYPRARRHPTAAPFLFGTKDRVDIFDLAKTAPMLEKAEAFVRELAASGKTLLFVGGKNEVVAVLKGEAERVGQPYVAGRWIGGTLTNFKNIRQRIARMEKLIADRESGELEKKYTKKEQLLLQREVDNLDFRFGGITQMSDLPAALFVVDSRHEHTAVREAKQLKIPVIALSSSDCDFGPVTHAIPGNDTSMKSTKFVITAIANAYAEGRRGAAAKAETPPAKI